MNKRYKLMIEDKTVCGICHGRYPEEAGKETRIGKRMVCGFCREKMAILVQELREMDEQQFCSSNEDRSCMSCGLKMSPFSGDVCQWCYSGVG
jgi:hypothetical protein